VTGELAVRVGRFFKNYPAATNEGTSECEGTGHQTQERPQGLSEPIESSVRQNRRSTPPANRGGGPLLRFMGEVVWPQLVDVVFQIVE
jgi:hypothetical protein